MFQPNMVLADNNGGGDNNENNNNDNIHGGINVGGEGFNSGNTSENQEARSGHNQGRPPQKKKRYHRHTHFQIREMENFFKECPHPDDKQRKQLGRQLGLDHLQIKFWFQNKRTQNKNQLERIENTHLRQKNQKLKAENHQCQEAIANATCSRCGGQTAIGNLSFEEHHLRISNSRLTKEIHQLSVMAARFMSKPGNSSTHMSPPIPSPPLEVRMGTVVEDANVYVGDGGNLSRSINGPDNKTMILELAFGAMEEFLRMAHVGEPLWMGGINGTSLALNLNEYTRIFQNGLGPKLNGYRTEASRDTALVAMGHLSIVETLMNENLWSTMFPGMIASAIIHEEIFPGVGNFDGAVQIMSSELQVVSPLVATRTSYFVRYCKQQGEGLWAVVDVSIDHLFPNLQLKCHRQPSGCLIQKIQSGYSKVTCIEHVEVDDSEDNHNVFKHLIRTGQAFGANRWLATLDRQCERISSIVNSDNPSMEPNGLIALTNLGKISFLKLAERMVRIFLAGMNTSMVTTYQAETGDHIKVMTVMSLNDPGIPNGVVLCTATSFWVPVPPKTIFDFLRDGNNRERWDVLSTKGHVNKVMEIPNGRDSRNCVALFQGADTIQNNMMMIQECSTDPTASFVIYAPVDMPAIENVLSGNDSDFVALLPTGVAIVPDGTAPGGDGGGSLLTVACQMIVETDPSSQLTVSNVATCENLIRLTARRMRGLFSYQAA